MAKLPMGKKAVIKALVRIIEDEKASIAEKLEACKIYTQLYVVKNKQDKPKKPETKIKLLGK